MDTLDISIIIVAIVLLLLGIVTLSFVRKKENRQPNYRALFILGIAFMPIGISTKNIAMMALGFIFLTIGLVHQKKWKEEKKWSELSPREKNVKILIIGIGVALFFAGIIMFFIVPK